MIDDEIFNLPICDCCGDEVDEVCVECGCCAYCCGCQYEDDEELIDEP